MATPNYETLTSVPSKYQKERPDIQSEFAFFTIAGNH